MKLYTKIFIGLVAGIVFGLIAGEYALYVEFLGTIFIRLITMVVVPLVMASLILGTASLGNIKQLGRIGLKTFLYYTITTAIAISIGLTLANILKPGAGIDDTAKKALMENYEGVAKEKVMSAKDTSVVDMLVRIIPTNPFASMASNDMLGLIFFSLSLGVALTYLPPEKTRGFINGIQTLNDAVVELVHLVMKFAPIGVFGLMSVVVAKFGVDILYTLIQYSLVVFIGLALHIIITYSASVKFLGKRNPISFLKDMREVMILAFSTSSSNATLPVNMDNCTEKFGVSPKISSFVLPLGATINMDGTALYQGVAAVFIAQVYGIDLTLTDQLMIILTATMASVGAAGIPGAGLITLTVILQTIGIPVEGIALILGVDRILDMCRTVVNVTGDASCALFVSESEKVK
ncbi:dicarboxylate/amino acid:cation symporter [bacterium]|nr:MAG: dicarboxylate/amino acid:cation symporter [bacterium]